MDEDVGSNMLTRMRRSFGCVSLFWWLLYSMESGAILDVASGVASVVGWGAMAAVASAGFVSSCCWMLNLDASGGAGETGVASSCCLLLMSVVGSGAMHGILGSLNRAAVPVADPAPDGSLPVVVLPSQCSSKRMRLMGSTAWPNTAQDVERGGGSECMSLTANRCRRTPSIARR